MNTKSILRFISVVVLGLILTGCQAMKEANKPFKHNTPLIRILKKMEELKFKKL